MTLQRHSLMFSSRSICFGSFFILHLSFCIYIYFMISFFYCFVHCHICPVMFFALHTHHVTLRHFTSRHVTSRHVTPHVTEITVILSSVLRLVLCGLSETVICAVYVRLLSRHHQRQSGCQVFRLPTDKNTQRKWFLASKRSVKVNNKPGRVSSSQSKQRDCNQAKYTGKKGEDL